MSYRVTMEGEGQMAELTDLIPGTEYLVLVRISQHDGPGSISFFTPHTASEELWEEGGKVEVRGEEIGIVMVIFLLWLSAVALFFHRWGKIRMLEPYQPQFHPPAAPAPQYSLKSGIYGFSCETELRAESRLLRQPASFRFRRDNLRDGYTRMQSSRIPSRAASFHLALFPREDASRCDKVPLGDRDCEQGDADASQSAASEICVDRGRLVKSAADLPTLALHLSQTLQWERGRMNSLPGPSSWVRGLRAPSDVRFIDDSQPELRVTSSSGKTLQIQNTIV
ncbi:unnamed protein product [Darwinula stevensoni]|uniref:Fibronectin type-III domain-containing protein n=1 Tax=Darwinula stevensoni TaxID=69355 RepID=A0A7R9AD15_9CRUS|nr:unnamed protein product [Darwinula stevensoni]CAG0900878.1 unnamed protein product [Darwinula stevensoni]